MGAQRSDFTVTFMEPWHITHRGVVVMGSADHQTKRRFYRRLTPPKDAWKRERWQAVKDFFNLIDDASLFVESVSLAPEGTVEILLSQGYSIRRFVAGAFDDELTHLMIEDEFKIICFAAGRFFVV